MAYYIATVIDDRRIELPKGALNLVWPGQEIGIELDETTAAPEPNERLLATLRDITELKGFAGNGCITNKSHHS